MFSFSNIFCFLYLIYCQYGTALHIQWSEAISLSEPLQYNFIECAYGHWNSLLYIWCNNTIHTFNINTKQISLIFRLNNTYKYDPFDADGPGQYHYQINEYIYYIKNAHILRFDMLHETFIEYNALYILSNPSGGCLTGLIDPDHNKHHILYFLGGGYNNGNIYKWYSRNDSWIFVTESSVFGNWKANCWSFNNSQIWQIGGIHQCKTVILYPYDNNKVINTGYCVTDGNSNRPELHLSLTFKHRNIMLILETGTWIQRYFILDEIERNNGDVIMDGNMPILEENCIFCARPGGIMYDEQNGIIYIVYNNSYYFGEIIDKNEYDIEIRVEFEYEWNLDNNNKTNLTVNVIDIPISILNIIINNAINNTCIIDIDYVTNTLHTESVSIGICKINVSTSICDEQSRQILIVYLENNLVTDFMDNIDEQNVLMVYSDSIIIEIDGILINNPSITTFFGSDIMSTETNEIKKEHHHTIIVTVGYVTGSIIVCCILALFINHCVNKLMSQNGKPMISNCNVLSGKQLQHESIQMVGPDGTVKITVSATNVSESDSDDNENMYNDQISEVTPDINALSHGQQIQTDGGNITNLH